MLPSSLLTVRLWCRMEFCWSLTQPYLTHNNQAISRAKQPDVRSNVITEIFWQTVLGSLAFGARCRVLLPGIGSSSSHPLDQDKHHLLQTLTVGFRVECKAMREDVWRHNVTITRDHCKHHGLDREFGFYQNEYKCVFRLASKHSEIFGLDTLS